MVAWLVSIAFHAAALFFAASMGVFEVMNRAPSFENFDEKIMVVELYQDYSTGGGGGGGGGSPAPGPYQPLGGGTGLPDEAVKGEEQNNFIENVPADEAADFIGDEQKSESESEPSYGEHSYSPWATGSTQVNTAPDGTGTGGTGGGIGGGHGTGIGPGIGDGTGGGGNGGGTASETGGDAGESDAVRPKEPPHLLRASSPDYPPSLRKKNVEGAVVVRLIVGADGSVEMAELVESSGYDEMDMAAMGAAQEYIFEPAENAKGDPVRCAIVTTIRFELR